MEIKYNDSLANPVIVKNKNGKWQVCIDFNDLNKECPKYSFFPGPPECFRKEQNEKKPIYYVIKILLDAET